MPLPSSVDILVVGTGNAGFAAAISAKEAGAQTVILVDKAPEHWAGGNSFFTAGAYRTIHNGVEDLLPLVNNVDEATAKRIDIQPYTEADFSADLERVCQGRSDPVASQILIRNSLSTIRWIKSISVRLQLSFNRQAYEIDGRLKFWGGLALKVQDGGRGLIEDYKAAALRHRVPIYYSTALVGVLTDPSTGDVTGAKLQRDGKEQIIHAQTIILAAGGFESNPRMRSQYLGPGWDLARVRGTPYNTGEVLELALRDLGAQPAGHWSGCHSVAWDANASANSGDREISNELTKSGYPLGLMINTKGDRFVDEGSDLRNYTYAKFGRAILQQPQQTAFQLFDQRTIPWLRQEEYREERVQRVVADTIPDLAEKLSSLGLEDVKAFIDTVNTYNKAVYTFQEENRDRKWDPSILDGCSTQSHSFKLPLGKTNWALPMDQGPFMAVRVTCGITFTFGGLAVNPHSAQVLSSRTHKEIPSLYGCGEIMGGLFYDNYPGGSGLTSGIVFGRIAGTHAAKSVAARRGLSQSKIGARI